MNVNQDLLGKTITGVIATRSSESGLREIWMLQFADGSHVEFVSPGARKALRNAAGQKRASSKAQAASRGSASGAGKPAERRRGRQSVRPVQLANSRAMRYRRDSEAGAQLSLNVA